MDIESILREMTLEEKFRFLTGGGLNHTSPVDRLGIPVMRLQDGPFGLRMKTQDEQSGMVEQIRSAFPNCHDGAEVVSTAFPCGAAMGAAWDAELVHEIGAAIGEECRAYGVRAILGPAMNLKRHPLCGRNFEYFSEDPILTERLAAAYVAGAQGQGVAACPKHFAMNNQERSRFTVSSEADERTMRELYLRPFERVVRAEKPWSIMCAYNRVNGVLCSEHHQLLQEILREEWGFDGIVASDWGSVRNRAWSLLASVDLCMPYQEEALDQLREAYDQHLIDDAVVDEAVRRMLCFFERTGQAGAMQVCDFEAHDRLALQAARESIVLLKNENQMLPLRREKLKKLLVAGETAVHPYIVSTWNWNQEADAILVSWLGGQAMGRAVAETLCGLNNPSGKLSETFPRRLSDAPAMDEYPGNGYQTVYREGVCIGYRHYDQRRIRPDYAFGFGLSYTHFRYENLTLEGDRLAFDLINDGVWDGDEIAQVYVRFPANAWVSHPPKELKAFRRISLKAGETKRVEIPVTEDFFTYYNPAMRRWTAEAGTYTILVGGSSDDLPLSVETDCGGPANISAW